MNTEKFTKLPPAEHTYEWPQQAAKELNWKEASLRWEVLRVAYPKHPATWLRGAAAHIEAGDLQQADILLQHARQLFPDHLNSLITSATLAMRRQEWNAAKAYLQQAREKHPDKLQTWIKSAE